ncbi:MAG: signal recognition particle-docking protein FtsY [Finegoldia sp.]|nr:signal recognition particle-docking protein FtsY [Finegoldia sp.]
MLEKFKKFFSKKEEKVEEEFNKEVIDKGLDGSEESSNLEEELREEVEQIKETEDLKKAEELEKEKLESKSELENEFNEEVKDKGLKGREETNSNLQEELREEVEQIKEAEDLKEAEELEEERLALETELENEFEKVEKEVEEDLEKESLETEDEAVSLSDSQEKSDLDKEIEENTASFADDLVDEQEVSENLNLDESYEAPEEKTGFFSKLKNKLSKTRNNISDKIDNLLVNYRTVDEELFEEIEEMLISADIGVESTLKIVEDLRYKVKLKNIKDVSQIKSLLIEIMKENLKFDGLDNKVDLSDKLVIMVVGVNGVGKTTTIGKLAMRYKDKGKKVILGAADTFRAAAIEQLSEWGSRAGVDVISGKEGSDPASIVYDSIMAMKSKNADVLIIDTAGRLHNKKNLMAELTKMNKIIDREMKDVKKEVFIVIDGTTGQNAIIQTKEFMNATELSGAVVTKLDGTAKGGMIFPIQMELKIPVKYIGLGEKITDLVEFDSDSFVDAIVE